MPEPGNPQAWDRYAFTNNNPVRFVDPTGHYGEDVHYYLTYQVVYDIALGTALSYGYSEQAAHNMANWLGTNISNGDMAADVMRVENGKAEFALEYLEYNPVIRPGLPLSGESVAPHWYTTDQAEVALQEAENPFDFGIALHKYQDSFSHWQKLGKPGTPGEIWDQHALNHLPWNENVDEYNPYLKTEFGEIDAQMREGMTKYVTTYLNDYFSSRSSNFYEFRH